MLFRSGCLELVRTIVANQSNLEADKITFLNVESLCNQYMDKFSNEKALLELEEAIRSYRAAEPGPESDPELIQFANKHGIALDYVYLTTTCLLLVLIALLCLCRKRRSQQAAPAPAPAPAAPPRRGSQSAPARLQSVVVDPADPGRRRSEIGRAHV